MNHPGVGGPEMKNPVIPLPVDKVTISDQGRAASRKWNASDTPFLRILREAEASPRIGETVFTEEGLTEVEEVQAIGDGDQERWSRLPSRMTRKMVSRSPLRLDIGSRLEIDAPFRSGSVVVRSTTRINLEDQPQAYETRWEVLPAESPPKLNETS